MAWPMDGDELVNTLGMIVAVVTVMITIRYTTRLFYAVLTFLIQQLLVFVVLLYCWRQLPESSRVIITSTVDTFCALVAALKGSSH